MFKRLLNDDDVKNIKDYIDKSKSYKGIIEEAEMQYENNILDAVEDKYCVIESKNKLRNLFDFYEKLEVKSSSLITDIIIIILGSIRATWSINGTDISNTINNFLFYFGVGCISIDIICIIIRAIIIINMRKCGKVEISRSSKLNIS